MTRRSTTRGHPRENPPKLGMTPMIDVTFLILIFFMCTLKFRTVEGTLDANLPKDVGPSTHEDPSKLETLPIRIVVLDAGNLVRRAANGSLEPYTAEHAAAGLRFDHDDTRVLRYDVGARSTTDLGEAEHMLERHFEAAPERRLRLDPREGTTNADVVDVLDAVIEIGFTDIVLTGSSER